MVADRLCLHARHHPGFRPVSVDWATPDLQRRVAAGRRQPLARAVGLHRKPASKVLDGTAGFGRDGFTLAALGARVLMAERARPIVELLRDGLRRAATDEATSAAAARIEIAAGDAREHMGTHRWDAIFLDPMYPGHDRDARSKKEMQFLRELLGDADDAGELLAAALASGAPRVVVKRPARAPHVGPRAPTFELRGTQARFDVYVTTPVEIS